MESSAQQVNTMDAPPTSSTSNVSWSLPPEKPETQHTRSLVIAAFWTVIIFLGLPIWWKTTSVYRAGLPIADMNEWADGKVWLLLFLVMTYVLLFGVLLKEGLRLMYTGSNRHVAPFFRCKFPFILLRCKCRRQSILFEPPNMLSMI